MIQSTFAHYFVKVRFKLRGARDVRWIGDFFQDVRFGLRMLRKSPGYSVTAIAALGLGIGANTALFALFNGMVSRNLPVPEPDRVVTLLKQPGGVFTYAEYQHYRTHNTA